MFRTLTTSRPARLLAAAGVLGLLATGCTSNTPEAESSASSAPAGALAALSDVSGVLLVQPAARRPMTPAAARSLAGRDVMRVRDMLVSLRGRGGAVWW